MKLNSLLRASLLSVAMLLLITIIISFPALAKKPAEKGKMVDSGSFSVYLSGKRIATETFRIEQESDSSLITSEFKTDDGAKASQKSELRIAANGDLRRYEWHELSPGKAQTVVEPSEQFLIERVTKDPAEKPMEKPFLMPASTVVLDDFFFSHRQVLAWRYIAQCCNGKPQPCTMTKMQFGVIVPRQQSSLIASMEYGGKESLTIRGVKQELERFTLSSEGMKWTLWMDSSYKIRRILIDGNEAEVLRD